MENLTDYLVFIGDNACAEGGFGVIRKAQLQVLPKTAGCPEMVIVIVKFPKVSSITYPDSADDSGLRKLAKRWGREVKAGRRVLHPNILHHLGLCDNPDGRFKPLKGIVLPYCTNGDAWNYIHKHLDADGFQILCGVAAALFALHTSSPPVIHGDIKANNILISDGGQALVADFGLSRICDIRGFTTESMYGSHRWMAEEMLKAIYEDRALRTTAAADVWGFAMTILELLTRDHPYAEIKNSYAVLPAVVVRGERPKRPYHPNVTDAIWALLQRCWQQEPSARPDARHVGLVLDIMYGRPRITLEARTVLEILDGKFDMRLRPEQVPPARSDSLPYKCKWLHCPQSFMSMNECIVHECAEFERRLLIANRR